MQTRSACLIRNKTDKRFIGRGYDLIKEQMELTKEHFKALRFSSIAEASEWLLNAIYAPNDAENYEYVEVKITIEEMKEVMNDADPQS